MAVELKADDIKKRINTIKETVSWLKSNYCKYKVKAKDIRTKSIFSRKRDELSKLCNDLLEKLFDETKLELDIILYILEECNNDYIAISSSCHSIAPSPELTNLIIEKFGKTWRDLNKSCELTAIQSNLEVTKASATSGTWKSDNLMSTLTDSIKGSVDRYMSRQHDLSNIRQYVKDLANIPKSVCRKKCQSKDKVEVS